MHGALTYLEPSLLDRPDRPHPGPRHSAQPHHPGPHPTQPVAPAPAAYGTPPPGPATSGYVPEPGSSGYAPGDGVYGYRAPQEPADPYRPPRPPSPFEMALPDLRNKVVNRLNMANGLFARQAWERRRRDPLGPHALVFCYAEPPVGEPARCALRIAARLFLAADESRLPLLLYEMVHVARNVLQAGGDPRTDLSNWHDPMSGRAFYVGVGVSSLDTPAATWRQVQETANGELDIPGRCYAQLVDGSRLLIDRLAHRDFGKVVIGSTHLISDVSGEPLRRWTYDFDLADPHRQDPATRDTWQWLDQLHHVILRGSRAQ